MSRSYSGGSFATIARMRVVFYTHPALFDTALPFCAEMSRRVELHVLLEVGPTSWQSSAFELRHRELSTGLVPAAPILANAFPASARRYWKELASFNLVVHRTQKSVHPGSWWTSRDVAKFVRALQPDILHFDNTARRMAPVSGALSSIPTVQGVHDPEQHSGERNWRSAVARRVIFRGVNQYILHNETQKQSFCKRYGVPRERVAVVRLGLNVLAREWLAAPSDPEPRTVLLFGRLSAYKGLAVFYQSARQIAESIPDLRIIVAGRPGQGYNPPAPPLLANGGQVEVIADYISNSRTAELFQRAAVVACPYLDATQSGVVLTAYAFDRLVVATNVGGIPEYVQDGETGLLVSPGDPRALADAIIRLLRDEDLRARLGAGMRRLAAEVLNWARVADETLVVYEHVVKRC